MYEDRCKEILPSNLCKFHSCFTQTQLSSYFYTDREKLHLQHSALSILITLVNSSMGQLCGVDAILPITLLRQSGEMLRRICSIIFDPTRTQVQCLPSTMVIKAGLEKNKSI